MWRLDGTHVHDLGRGRRVPDPRTAAAEAVAATEIVRILSRAPDPTSPAPTCRELDFRRPGLGAPAPTAP